MRRRKKWDKKEKKGEGKKKELEQEREVGRGRERRDTGRECGGKCEIVREYNILMTKEKEEEKEE